MSFNITLLADFIAHDILEKDALFPHLGKFQLPTFCDRYKDAVVDDVSSHVAAFPSWERAIKEMVESLSVRLDDVVNALEVADREKDELKDHLREALVLSAESQTQKNWLVEGLVASAGEVKVLKKRVADLQGENRDLEVENRQVEAFTRLAVRDMLMRRHLNGKDPMSSAVEELAAYLADAKVRGISTLMTRKTLATAVGMNGR